MGKGIILLSGAVLIVSFSTYATTWFDDFESYTVGDDLSDYPDWSPGIGHAGCGVAEYESGKRAEPGWGWDVYEPPGGLTDSKVSFDILFTGVYMGAGALYRYNEEGDYYGYGIVFVNDYAPYDDAVFLEIYNPVDYVWGVLETYSLGPDYFENDVWYHVEASIWGCDPLYHYINIDDDLVISEETDMYPGCIIESGKSGLVSRNGNAEAEVYVDNYEVDDGVTIGIQPSSLGALKAAFK
jgi:hypothetical protein